MMMNIVISLMMKTKEKQEFGKNEYNKACIPEKSVLILNVS